MKLTSLASAAFIALAGSAAAQGYGEYPAPMPGYPFQRSTLTDRRVFIPPYRRPFRVRVYTTPPRQPFYNVPPYAVISPY